MITSLKWSDGIQYLRDVFGTIPKRHVLPYNTTSKCYDITTDVIPEFATDKDRTFFYFPFDVESKVGENKLKAGFYSYNELDEINSLDIFPCDYNGNGLEFTHPSNPIFYYEF